MKARLEIGEVLLTASIFEVWREVALGVMPRNVTARDEICECIPGITDGRSDRERETFDTEAAAPDFSAKLMNELLC
jgi:hypothetical protein